MKKMTVICLLTCLCSLKVFSQADVIKKELKAINIALTESDLDEIKITSQYTDTKHKVEHIYGNQQLSGLDIYGAVFDAHFLEGKLLAIHQNFIVDAKSKRSPKDDKIDAQSAIEIAIEFSGIKLQPTFGKYLFSEPSETKSELIIPDISTEPIKFRQVFYFIDSLLQKGWLINLYPLKGDHWWNLIISAYDGTILHQDDWVLNCHSFPDHADHKQEFIPGETVNTTNKAGQNTYNVFQITSESPNHSGRSIAQNPADSLSSPFGWHDNDGVAGSEYTITRGNNVYARDDKDANNSGGTSPNGGTNLNFDAPFDISQSAANFLDASIINLFYMNNAMHDVWYNYGFDEVSGNFQQHNYNRGTSGIGANDYVNADAQDGSGTNNANFATPDDGQSPRMQMFLWNGGGSSVFLLRVNSPAAIAKKYLGIMSGFTPQLNKTLITGNLILVNSGSSGSFGCSALTNAAQISNNIALIDRGNCTFLEKVQFAQQAGAKAVVVINNTTGNLFSMGGTSSGINIPAIMISQADGQAIKAQLAYGVNVTLFDSSGSTQRVFDSDFDNGIIAHEYGHGISNRLTGGPFNSSCLTNQEQMGEGWSDFFALVMTHQPNAKSTDLRGMGTYVTGSGTDGPGIRTYPYSTDMATSRYVYDNIKSFSVPHGVGSVWCSMLWDMYWALIDKYGYDPDIYKGTGGNNIAMQLVIDGLKLQPCSPGFIDGRDAILLADRVNNGGANQKIIWESFARRGLGYSASQGSSSSRTDGKEAYDIDPRLINAVSISKLAESTRSEGSILTYTVNLKNNTPNVLKNVTFKDTLDANVSYVSSDGCPMVVSGKVLSLHLDSMIPAQALECRYYVRLNVGKFTRTIQADSLENGVSQWLALNDVGTIQWKLVQNKFRSVGNSFFVGNPATKSDQSLYKEYDLSGLQKPGLSFWHFYNTENGWDGGVVEMKISESADNWTDAKDFFVRGAYNTSIAFNPESNISGRPAFSGLSNGFEQSIVDLSSFAGQKLWFRFRFVSDGAAGGEGWYVDDVDLLDLHFVRNTAWARVGNDEITRASVVTIVSEGTGGVSTLELTTSPGIEIFPNPTHEGIMIFTHDVTQKAFIYSNEGKLMFTASLNTCSTMIDLSDFTSGVYFLEIRSITGVKNFKVIKY